MSFSVQYLWYELFYTFHTAVTVDVGVGSCNANKRWRTPGHHRAPASDSLLINIRNTDNSENREAIRDRCVAHSWYAIAENELNEK